MQGCAHSQQVLNFTVTRAHVEGDILSPLPRYRDFDDPDYSDLDTIEEEEEAEGSARLSDPDRFLIGTVRLESF